MPNKTCSYGDCRSSSRKLTAFDDIFFVPFVKPLKERQKCLRWVRACNRKDFKVANVSRYTYICSLHFVGGRGPTSEHPDPVRSSQLSFKCSKTPTKPIVLVMNWHYLFSIYFLGFFTEFAGGRDKM